MKTKLTLWALFALLSLAVTCPAQNRLKDKPEATTPAGDDWIYLDGTTNGVRKLAPSYFSSGGLLSTNGQIGTAYTLAATDLAKKVTMTNAGANTVTLPLNATVALSVGFRASIQQLGVGITSIAGEGGVTITQASGTLVLGGVGHSAWVEKTATNAWTVWVDPLDNPGVATAPTANDDAADGYQVGSYWADTRTTPASFWTCRDNTVGTALWERTSTFTRITSITSNAAPTVNTDITDCVRITALATNITSMTTNLSGTPGNFDQLQYRIKDNGTPRTISWGASFASRGATLPTTTTASKTMNVYFEWNATASTWDCVASIVEL